MTDNHAATHSPDQEDSTVMPTKERADAISRAKRALKALGEHPGATRKQLGTAREHVNDCHRLSDAGALWEAARAIRASAAAVYGVFEDEPVPKLLRRWVTPRGRKQPASPRRPRQVPRN